MRPGEARAKLRRFLRVSRQLLRMALSGVWTCRTCGIPVHVATYRGTTMLLECPTDQPHSCVRFTAPKEAKCV